MKGHTMVNLKFYLLSLSILSLTCTISHAMNQNRTTPQEALALVKAAQQIQRPPTPLDPFNRNHRPYIDVLQTSDGRPVTAADVLNYIGLNPAR